MTILCLASYYESIWTRCGTRCGQIMCQTRPGTDERLGSPASERDAVLQIVLSTIKNVGAPDGMVANIYSELSHHIT